MTPTPRYVPGFAGVPMSMNFECSGDASRDSGSLRFGGKMYRRCATEIVIFSKRPYRTFWIQARDILTRTNAADRSVCDAVHGERSVCASRGFGCKLNTPTVLREKPLSRRFTEISRSSEIRTELTASRNSQFPFLRP